ncbi:WecB/TagA/CpsF family glycosyltransferase [Candidatus Sumerlaeota bacterium]|nr:WecB/TagA/CpsF family glycosyltransferase [Candidatus Sumerlaeota bacterium]
MMKKINFLGIDVVNLTTAEFVDWVIERTKQRLQTFITYINAHCVNVAFRDAEYKKILRRADAVYADGQAIVQASKFLGYPLPERINAGDFFLEFCQRCAEEKLKMFLLGSDKKVAETIGKRLQSKVPELCIAGTHSGFFTPAQEPELISRINSASPDILLVGMGVPRQEKWVYKNRAQLSVPVIWCVGALFEYYAGVRARAPRWMRRCGLEWAFRLVLEPRRLWRRYLIGNPEFIARLLRYKLRKHSPPDDTEKHDQ